MLGLYVHIPFCESICTYCDFCKRIKKDDQMIDDYIHVLKHEYKKLNKTYDTIYIGGGTPSMLSIDQLEALLSIFKDQHPKEYTIEVNPESYTHEKGLLFLKYNINRVSIGIQTFNESILKTLNRKHRNQDVFNTINDLINLGIQNINVDLIFSLPNQTLQDVKNDLAVLASLPITHVSYYSLILEDNTILYHHYKKGLFTPTDDDLEALMYNEIRTYLSNIGYTHYEVSNFHKGYPSMHNMIYWTNHYYDAIGAGSHGFYIDRYYHTKNITTYIQEQTKKVIPQTPYMNYQDYLIFGLRLIEGVDLRVVKERYNRNPLNDFPKIRSLIRDGLLTLSETHLKVTDQGLLYLNQIEVIFI